LILPIIALFKSMEDVYDLETSPVVGFLEHQSYKISLIGKLLSGMGIDYQKRVLSQEEKSKIIGLRFLQNRVAGEEPLTGQVGFIAIDAI